MEKYDDQALSFNDEFVQRIGRYYGQVIKELQGEVEVSFQEGTEEPILMDCEDLFSDEIIEKSSVTSPALNPDHSFPSLRG